MNGEDQGVAFGPGSTPSGQAASRLVGSAGTIPNAGWKPAIVAKAQTPCWPWHLRERTAEHPAGSQCARCHRDIAVPRPLQGYEAICVYCALDIGVLPLVEIEPEDERSLHQRAMEERAAQGMSAGTAKTLQAAESEARQPGRREPMRPNPASPPPEQSS
jgi:hypothetical protein